MAKNLSDDELRNLLQVAPTGATSNAISDDELRNALNMQSGNALNVGYGQVSPVSRAQPDQGIDVVSQGITALGRGLQAVPRRLSAGGEQFLYEALKRFPSTGPIAERLLENLGQEYQTAEKSFQESKQQSPVLAMIGEAAPLMAAPQSMIAGAAIPAAMAGMEYGTAQQRRERAISAGIGGFAGSALGKAAGAIINPIQPGARREAVSEALSAMERLGAKPTTSQLTGSTSMARMEDVARSVPGGAGGLSDFDTANAIAYNSAALRSIGQVGEEITPAALSNARDEISKVYNAVSEISSRNGVRIDANVGNAAGDLIAQQTKLPESIRNKQIMKLADEAMKASSLRSRISGETYNTIRSELSNRSYDAFNSGESSLGHAYKKLLDSLDNAAERSLPAELSALLKDARPKYANLMLLEKGQVVDAGNIVPQRLAAAMRQRNPAGYKEARYEGELADLAKIGEVFKPMQLGSMTQPRSVLTGGTQTMPAIARSYLYGLASTNPAVTGYASAMRNIPESVSNIADAATMPLSRLISQIAAEESINPGRR